MQQRDFDELRNGTSRAPNISPFHEMGAYEALWEDPKTTFKSLAELFSQEPHKLPSAFVSAAKAHACAQFVQQQFTQANIAFEVCMNGMAHYPVKLRDAAWPVELLYYQGRWDLTDSRCIAVVGTRKPSQEGLARTRRLVRNLVKDGFTVVSGLAAGVDRQAHTTAMEEGGQTIAVLGTPLSRVYPKEHAELQRSIAEQFLVISQVPVKRYEEVGDYRINRSFFPERNKLMSALSEATIIVEASETSGTLIQARAALQQGRQLFILDSCFRNAQLTWPERFAKQGATRVKDYDDVQRQLVGEIRPN